MGRRTRKQMVGKAENVDRAEDARLMQALERLLHREWWSLRSGWVDTSRVLNRLPHTLAG